MASVMTCSEFVAESEKIYGLRPSREKSWSVYRSRRPRLSRAGVLDDLGAFDAKIAFIKVLLVCLAVASALGFAIRWAVPDEKIPLVGGLLSAAALCQMYFSQRKSHGARKPSWKSQSSAASQVSSSSLIADGYVHSLLEKKRQ